MSRLKRDETAGPVSRYQILRRGQGQGNIHFRCSADRERGWQPHLADPYSAICADRVSSVRCKKKEEKSCTRVQKYRVASSTFLASV